MKSIKNLLMFTIAAFTTMILMSCGGTDVVNGQETISIGTAFGYFFGKMSYLIPLVLATLGGGYMVYYAVNDHKVTGDWGFKHIALIGVGVLIFMFALLYAPAEAAANTTKEMYERTGEVIR